MFVFVFVREREREGGGGGGVGEQLYEYTILRCWKRCALFGVQNITPFWGIRYRGIFFYVLASTAKG